MAYEELVFRTMKVVGPSGLQQALEDLYKKVKNDPEFAANEHYIMYTLSNQQSLIKVDMSQRPFQFWYKDILGRPATATPSVMKTIENFLAEKGEIQDFTLQFDDLAVKDKEAKIAGWINGESFPLPDDPLLHAYELLAKEKRMPVNPKVSRIGMFSSGKKSLSDQKDAEKQPDSPRYPTHNKR